MRRHLFILAALAAVGAAETSAETPGYSEIMSDGSEITYECMPAISGAASLTAPKMRFVLVRFPQVGPYNEGNYGSYPAWADPAANPSWLERELGDYFTAMSVGMQQPDIDIVTDPSNPGQPWTADFGNSGG